MPSRKELKIKDFIKVEIPSGRNNKALRFYDLLERLDERNFLVVGLGWLSLYMFEVINIVAFNAIPFC